MFEIRTMISTRTLLIPTYIYIYNVMSLSFSIDLKLLDTFFLYSISILELRNIFDSGGG